MKKDVDFQNSFNDLKEAYANVKENEGNILYNTKSAEFENMIKEEAVADYLGTNLGNQEYINELVNGKESRNVAQKIYDAIVKFLDKVTGYKSEEAYLRGLKDKFEKAFNAEFSNDEKSIKYHISKNLNSDIDNVLNNINERKPVRLRDYTPSILVNNGIKDLPMYENPSHIRKNILTESEAKQLGLSINTRDHYHGLGKETYIKTIDSLDNPRVIFRNKNKSKEYLILTVVKDIQNNNIVVPIEIETDTTVNRVKIDINRVKSVYGFENKNNIDLNDYIKYNIRKNNFEKIYEKKIDQGTGSSTVARSNNSISSSNKDVNTTTKYSIQKEEKNTENSNKSSFSSTKNENNSKYSQDTLFKKEENLNNNLLLENSNKINYNNVESERNINGQGKKKTGNNELFKQRNDSNIQQKQKQQEYKTKSDYQQYEKSIREVRQITEIQKQIKSEFKNKYNKDIVYYNGNENDVFSGGASTNNENIIYIDINRAEEFGNKRIALHEVFESKILFSDENSKDIIYSAMDTIMEDINWEAQKQEFWRNQEGVMPSDFQIAKDIICDRFAELNNSEELDYKILLSEKTINNIDSAINYLNIITRT